MMIKELENYYKNILEIPRLEKVVINIGVGENVIDSKKVFELYDVNIDPYEKNELSKKHPEVFNTMKETFYKMPAQVQNEVLFFQH